MRTLALIMLPVATLLQFYRSGTKPKTSANKIHLVYMWIMTSIKAGSEQSNGGKSESLEQSVQVNGPDAKFPQKRNCEHW